MNGQQRLANLMDEEPAYTVLVAQCLAEAAGQIFVAPKVASPGSLSSAEKMVQMGQQVESEQPVNTTSELSRDLLVQREQLAEGQMGAAASEPVAPSGD